MENFFYEDGFFSDLSDLMDSFDFDEDHLDEIEDDWKIECHESSLEPIQVFTPEFICDGINEERFDEEGTQYQKVCEILKANIDFDKINSLMPRMYFPTSKKFTITKKDIVDAV